MVKQKLILVIMSLVAAFAPYAFQAGRVQADASCMAPSVRWASSSNTIYIEKGAVCTPGELQKIRPAQVVSVSPGVYLLRANIKLTGNGTLQIHGPAGGGDTSELRLLSNNTSSSAAVVNITGDVGNVSISDSKVTSWNEAAGGPDTEYASYKRAFIRVRSRVVNGVPQTGRMDIVNSDVGYLGYYAAESYGLVWKVMDSAFSAVDVLGDITNSRLHHNYFGAYMYGAYGMNITGNEVDNNVKYGLDPHDDSDYLTITGNKTHHNGNHGIICSQRCNNLVISGNQSYNNIGHGIMLHRSTDFTTVDGNAVTANTDTGIALFESNNNTISNNVIDGNKHSIRLSVGSSLNTFTNNRILNGKSGNAIYTYKGSDTPARPGNDGISRNNTWQGNSVTNSTSYVLKLQATNGDQFLGNDFRGNPLGKYDLSGASNVSFSGNQADTAAPSAVKQP